MPAHGAPARPQDDREPVWPLSHRAPVWLENYRAPAWLPGGNAQTIWAATQARRFEGPPLRWRRERLRTPDGDFVDVDHLEPHERHEPLEPLEPHERHEQHEQHGQHGRPEHPERLDFFPAAQGAPAAAPAQHLVLFHGLEGSSASQYAQAFAGVARARGWAYSVPHFRGCSGELNLAPRAYHSGDFEEIGWILARLRAMHSAPLLAVGISLGGNALLRWAEEAGGSAAHTAAAVAAVCSPIDLAASGRAIDRGFNWLVYSRMFLASMKPKALAKLARHPGLFDEARLRAARTLYEFDDCFTAPLHGFRDTPDYWARASALPHLAAIRIPALVLNACNDPFVPAASLPPTDSLARTGQIGHVTLWRPSHGGHVGFPAGRYPAQVSAMPNAVCDWLAAPSLV